MKDTKRAILVTDNRTPCAVALASHLARRGFRVLVNDRSGGGAPEGCEAVRAELCDDQAVRELLSACGEELSGVLHPTPPFRRNSLKHGTEEEFRLAFQEGPLASLHVARAAGEALAKNGSVVFLGSVHAERTTGCAPFSAMSCAAEQMLCREAAQDYGTRGVSFHYVRRGVMEQDLFLQSSLSNLYSAPEQKYPLRSLPGPESLYGLIDFLFSGSSGILNGADLCADGGMTQYYGTQFTEEELQAAEADWALRPAQPPAAIPHPESALSSLKGRRALITGGGKGVGAGIARVFCRAGMRVCIGWNSSRELAEHTLREIQEAGGEAFLWRADVSDRGQLEAMARETVSRYGGIDVLVNNAAAQPNRYLRHYDDDTFRWVWDVNLGGYWRALQACLPYLEESSCPRVINISSIHGKRPTVFDPGYAMTKGAIRMFTREAALELASKRITVNSINLGACAIEGKTGNYLFPLKSLPGTQENPGDPLGEICSPEDAGFLALYLARRESGHLTGSGIRLDGGSMLV